MAGGISSLRNALASRGMEFTPADMSEILQALAHAASFVGGKALFEWDAGVAIEIELDPLSDDCFVSLVELLDDEPEQEVFH